MVEVVSKFIEEYSTRDGLALEVVEPCRWCRKQKNVMTCYVKKS